MGRCPDVAIFRRFNEFNMLNLLSLQAEIAALRAEFWSQVQTDDLSGPPFETMSLDFEKQRGATDADNTEQYKILLSIRSKMREYSKRDGKATN